MSKCKKCNCELTCARCSGRQGGKKSRRTISAEQQAEMQAARKKKRVVFLNEGDAK